MTHYIHQTSKTNAEGKGDLFRETAREASSSSTSKKEEDKAQMPATLEDGTTQVGVQDWYTPNCLMCASSIHIKHFPSSTSMTHW